MTDYVQLTKIFETFEVTDKPDSFECCSFGHINSTFFVTVKDVKKYVLQKINTSIFKNPDELTANIVGVTKFLRRKVEAMGGDPKREVLHLIRSKQGGYYSKSGDGGYWRMYDYIKGAKTYQIVEDPILFYNSAVAFGNFQKLLSDYPADELHETIPNFHNTVSRFTDFKKALEADVCGRAASVQKEIDFVLERENVCSFITDRIASGEYPLRVTHNDTKLNNVMIDEVTKEGICVIDLDTVMPGSVLYDFGDSIRFGASSAEEDERDLGKVYMRLELFDDYAKGFLKGLGGSLSEAEMLGLPMGALVITFETGIRFLTDYLNGDTYFATHREGQNLDRARTQFKLVSDMEKKMPEMNSIIEKYL
ncbi:MAG: aminoglycoside phosphotransferase family protein [Ruminococcaceae bacterium]|nr:aminoglycoside phosphotransferase family protein [Oscillospiraceae bacterium]